MSRLSRSVCVTAILTAGAVMGTTLPAAAQASNPFKAGSVAIDTNSTAFLTAGMLQQPTTPPPPPGGGGKPAEGFGFGVKIGPLFTSYSSAASSKFKTNTGFEGGVWFGGNRGGRVGVMGEVLYAKKKQESENSTTGSTSLQYLEIPILIRVNIGSRSRSGVSVYGLVGPVFDVNLKASIGSTSVKSNYQSLDLGVLGGIGVEITRFLVEVRYNRGLRNVLNSSNASSVVDIKTNSFAALVGFRLN
jgi:hypothetical protein